MSVPEPGWYEDPFDPDRLRWWEDGWTDQTYPPSDGSDTFGDGSDDDEYVDGAEQAFDGDGVPFVDGSADGLHGWDAAGDAAGGTAGGVAGGAAGGATGGAAGGVTSGFGGESGVGDVEHAGTTVRNDITHERADVTRRTTPEVGHVVHLTRRQLREAERRAEAAARATASPVEDEAARRAEAAWGDGSPDRDGRASSAAPSWTDRAADAGDVAPSRTPVPPVPPQVRERSDVDGPGGGVNPGGGGPVRPQRSRVASLFPRARSGRGASATAGEVVHVPSADDIGDILGQTILPGMSPVDGPADAPKAGQGRAARAARWHNARPGVPRRSPDDDTAGSTLERASVTDPEPKVPLSERVKLSRLKGGDRAGSDDGDGDSRGPLGWKVPLAAVAALIVVAIVSWVASGNGLPSFGGPGDGTGGSVVVTVEAPVTSVIPQDDGSCFPVAEFTYPDSGPDSQTYAVRSRNVESPCATVAGDMVLMTFDPDNVAATARFD